MAIMSPQRRLWVALLILQLLDLGLAQATTSVVVSTTITSVTSSPATTQVTTAAASGGYDGNYGPPAYIRSCISYYPSMQAGLPGNITNYSELCAASSSLWSGMSSAQSCMSQQVQNIPVPNFDKLNSVLTSCNALVSSSVASSCSSLAAHGQSCTITSSYFGEPATAVAAVTLGTAVSTSSSASTQAVTQQPSATGVQGQTNNTGGSNIGLVAGVAVGAALGALIIAATAAFFIWRCRRRAKTAAEASELSGSTFDKSDIERGSSYSSRVKSALSTETTELGTESSSGRKELESPATYARTVGTLQELDAAALVKRQSMLKELASPEEVASEMATTEYTGSSCGTLSPKV